MKYIYLQSALHQDTELKTRAEAFFELVGKELGIPFSEGAPEEVGEEPISLFYVATGGTAGLVKRALEESGEKPADQPV